MTAGVLLDTNALLDDADVDAPSSVSVVSMIELASGLNASLPADVLATRRARYDQLAATYAPIPVNERVLAAYREVDAAVRRIGRTPRPRRLDLVIAATAVAYGLDLVTSNLADFRGLGSLLTVRAP